MSKSPVDTKCAICKRSSINKGRNCFDRGKPITLSVDEYNFLVSLDTTVSGLLNPKVGRKCLKVLRTKMNRAAGSMSPQAARAASVVMNRAAFPVHCLSPSKAMQTISKRNLKRKKPTSSGSSDSVRPAPPSVPRQDSTLILVELSDWVANRLKVPCGSKIYQSDAPCTGCILYWLSSFDSILNYWCIASVFYVRAFVCVM